MNKHIFCNRKNGVTVKGKFIPHKTVTEILSDQLERYANKMALRREKREAKNG